MPALGIMGPLGKPPLMPGVTARCQTCADVMLHVLPGRCRCARWSLVCCWSPRQPAGRSSAAPPPAALRRHGGGPAAAIPADRHHGAARQRAAGRAVLPADPRARRYPGRDRRVRARPRQPARHPQGQRSAPAADPHEPHGRGARRPEPLVGAPVRRRGQERHDLRPRVGGHEDGRHPPAPGAGAGAAGGAAPRPRHPLPGHRGRGGQLRGRAARAEPRRAGAAAWRRPSS